MASFWLQDEAPRQRRVRLDAAPEVEIVGGGVTGCAAAMTLAEAGMRVRLHEAREIAGGASGRNGGFALRGGAMPYDRAVTRLGRERARALWTLSERALDRLALLAGDALERRGSLRLEPDASELESEYEALRSDGFDVEWRDAPLRGFPAALFQPGDGSLHPARWVRRLAARAAEAGADIREESRVEALERLEAEQVLIATDGYTGGLVAELDAAIRPTRGQVVVTEPLPKRLYPCPHYARGGYDYWQQTRDRRLVIGGRRDTSLEGEFTGEEATTEIVQRAIEELAVELLGRLPRITHRWAGIWGTTADLLPLVGSLPEPFVAQSHKRVWVACGYSGHGNVLGLACGELVAQAILGRPAPELELFDPAGRL